MILITGASRGIGKYLLEEFIKTRADVYGTYNSTLPQTDKKHLYYWLNVTDYKSIESLDIALGEKLNKIILINCAGVNYSGFAHKSDRELWKQVIDINLTGTYNVIREFLPVMREQGYGRIINFSSVVAQKPTPGTSAYSASKAGLWGLAKSIAVENASRNITINNLNLGYFDIGMIHEVSSEFQAAIKKDIPGEKFGEPENIFKLINHLISNDYINGASIDINGGLL
ncbi:MAG: SDR family NAD(P)-dependent oxidoreductase [Bacteroidota bacterium]